MVKWYLAEGQHKKAVWHLPPPEVQRFGNAEAASTSPERERAGLAGAGS
jgi:predicted Fe-S protein YdhL (DUF1289 family)